MYAPKTRRCLARISPSSHTENETTECANCLRVQVIASFVAQDMRPCSRVQQGALKDLPCSRKSFAKILWALTEVDNVFDQLSLAMCALLPWYLFLGAFLHHHVVSLNLMMKALRQPCPIVDLDKDGEVRLLDRLL